MTMFKRSLYDHTYTVCKCKCLSSYHEAGARPTNEHYQQQLTSATSSLCDHRLTWTITGYSITSQPTLKNSSIVRFDAEQAAHRIQHLSIRTVFERTRYLMGCPHIVLIWTLPMFSRACSWCHRFDCLQVGRQISSLASTHATQRISIVLRFWLVSSYFRCADSLTTWNALSTHVVCCDSFKIIHWSDIRRSRRITGK